MLYGKAYMSALLEIVARYWHSQQTLYHWPSCKILLNALFVISLFGWPIALDDSRSQGGQRDHAPQTF